MRLRITSVLAVFFALSNSAIGDLQPFEYLTSTWYPRSTFTKLGGFSPWFPTTDVYGIDGTDVPDGCTVNQVQMYSRHHERLASGGTHTAIQALASKIANSTFAFKTNDPNLKYLQSFQWTVPAEFLTPVGAASAYAAGVAFLKRYGSLLPENAYFNWTGIPNIPVRSTDQSRVNVTAESFLSPTFNSTIASANCPASNTISFSANGIFNNYFQPLVVERLSPLMSGFNLTQSDVAALMNACPFDSFVKQRPSPICFIFSAEEWKGFNYAYDLNQFDNAGYGGPIGSAWSVGWVSEMIARLNGSSVTPVGSVNTTLDADPSTFPLNASIMLDFGHDTALESIITAMGLLKANYNGNVTLDQIDENRAWQSALISPMGGKLFVERLSCAANGSKNSTFVRMLLNSAIMPLHTLPDCEHSWGADKGLCGLSEFIASQSFALHGADFANCSKNFTGVPL
ncbi:phosphoglycerate mutase-like protein [Schizopora paradoxa]|uniref:Phosphoglycerate mutase-like protein n=1 Tax=Schizopora paradoxa TaxID=27342 RepID=A0A0H2S8Z1_9AGAM|nr:phosphoglycerate mutase-like protein [Schizopora paradoxa]